MAGARSVVSTIGLHGSASTWVFNIARELTVVSTGEAAMGSGFAEQVQAARALEKPGVTDLVIKSHRGDEAFDQWLKESFLASETQGTRPCRWLGDFERQSPLPPTGF